MMQNADEVIVFLHDDKSTYENKDKFPVQTYEHRRQNLLNTGLVDKVELVDTQDPSSQFKWFLRNEKDVVYYRGDDWEDFPGKRVLEERGVPIVFKPYSEGISSTKLRDEL